MWVVLTPASALKNELIFGLFHAKKSYQDILIKTTSKFLAFWMSAPAT
jgi:hypothetical protein